MDDSHIQGRLSWLGARMEARRNDIANIFRRLTALGTYAGTSIAVHTKFLHLMDQIAEEREKEYELLYEIETMEKRHSEMKQLKLLKRAESQDEKKASPFVEHYKEEEKPRRDGFLKILALLFLFGTQAPKQKVD